MYFALWKIIVLYLCSFHSSDSDSSSEKSHGHWQRNCAISGVLNMRDLRVESWVASKQTNISFFASVIIKHLAIRSLNAITCCNNLNELIVCHVLLCCYISYCHVRLYDIVLLLLKAIHTSHSTLQSVRSRPFPSAIWSNANPCSLHLMNRVNQI